jgi:hypothetical protein
MKRYGVYAKVIGSKYLGTFEAKSKKEAIDKALEENGSVSLCHSCSSECEDPELSDIIAEEESEEK